jgi:hypothetical protein
MFREILKALMWAQQDCNKWWECLKSTAVGRMQPKAPSYAQTSNGNHICVRIAAVSQMIIFGLSPQWASGKDKCDEGLQITTLIYTLIPLISRNSGDSPPPVCTATPANFMPTR